MTEITTESVQDRLAKLDSAAVERVAWIIEQIADAGHTVSPPGLPWAGQDSIVKATMVQYELERPAAEEAVELARLDLWHGNSGASGHVERKLLLARLNVIRRIILQGVREPKKTLTYVFKKKRNAKTGEVTMVRIPRREQVKEGFDVNAVRLLVDIEAMVAKLNDLEGGSTELVAEIFKQLEREDGQTKEKVVASISQKVKQMDLSRFTQAGKEVIEQAIEQETKRKKVSSKPVENGTDHEQPDRPAIPSAGDLCAPGGERSSPGGLELPGADAAG